MSCATVELKIMFIKLEHIIYLHENMKRNVRVRYVLLYITYSTLTDYIIIIIHDWKF